MTWIIDGDKDFLIGKIAFHEKKLEEWTKQLKIATIILDAWKVQLEIADTELKDWISRQIRYNDTDIYVSRVKFHKEKIAAYKAALAKGEKK